ncbi:MBOAT family O-acyltransferase [Olivibacter sitiensis]|uniref:MBOAT family O-acyltransferase n=1 Tax=Olivibacter sitiensis TaxID=376470 RepID=UPI0004884ED7|nr:MBOAT family O-acyltransferase [Olivibacter sitiensis]
MLFNSIHFLVFFLVIFMIYWSIPKENGRCRNVLLLFASYYFYAQWDWRFCFLLLFSTVLDFVSGLLIANASSKVRKKWWLWTSICVNVGFLMYFKYVNFFIDSFVDLLTTLGFQVHVNTLNIVLPIGISFYTFHGLSYVLDVYFGKFKATGDFVNYALFVCFFPMLLAGPIERAPHLLPQITSTHAFNYHKVVDGMRQFLWGLFKKVIIADNCAPLVNRIFDMPEQQSGMTLIYGAFLFTFQVYTDFSGYSDMALGTARMLGIELMKNFATPFFAKDLAEFVGRWHISLSTWFKYYIYKPAIKANSSTARKYFFVFLIFLISGFWHGARWTYIFVGLIAACFVILALLIRGSAKKIMARSERKNFIPSIGNLVAIGLNLTAASVLSILFRNENLYKTGLYFHGIFTRLHVQWPSYFSLPLAFLIFFMLTIEWFGRYDRHILEKIGMGWPNSLRWGFYLILLLLMALFMPQEQEEFIYFQF